MHEIALKHKDAAYQGNIISAEIDSGFVSDCTRVGTPYVLNLLVDVSFDKVQVCWLELLKQEKNSLH